MQSRQRIRFSACWIAAVALTSVGCIGTTSAPDNSDEGTSASAQSEVRRTRHHHGSAGSTSASGAAGQGTGGSNAGGDANNTSGGESSGGGASGGESSNGGQSSSGGEPSGGQPSAAAGSTGSAGSGESPTAATLSLGSNSITYRYTFTNTAQLDSTPIGTNSGSTLLAVVAMGTLSNMHAPSDNHGDTFRALLPAHNYVNWMGSGQQLFAATNIAGGSNTVISETMPDPNDEVTLSVVEIRGAHKISAVSVAETPTKGPVSSANVTTTGPAILVSWWWGDGGLTQISATTSPGWTRIHSLSRAQADTNVVQTEVAAKAVDAAGTYSITWSSDPDQGAVVYLVAIE